MGSPKLRLLIIVDPLTSVRSLHLRWATRGLTSRARVWLPERKEGLNVPTKQVAIVVTITEVRTVPSYLLLQLLKLNLGHKILRLSKVNLRYIVLQVVVESWGAC